MPYVFNCLNTYLVKFLFFFLYFAILSDLAAKTKINITNGDILYQLPLIFFLLRKLRRLIINLEDPPCFARC